MSATKELSRPDAARPTPRNHRRLVVAAAATATVLAAGGCVAAFVLTQGPDNPSGAPTDPISLPTNVVGLAPKSEQQDTTQTADWRKSAQKIAQGRTIVARTYGTTNKARSVQLVAARMNLGGKLALEWAGDTGTDVDGARCTRNLSFSPTVPPRERPTAMLCWRTSGGFSTYAFVVDPKASTPIPASVGAAAVNSVWKAAESES
jgi:hypothetical protein